MIRANSAPQFVANLTEAWCPRFGAPVLGANLGLDSF